MTNLQAKKFIESVLDYFSKMERAAELRNKRVTVRHFQQCWLIVCEAYYGAPYLAPERFFTPSPTADAQRDEQRPRWFKEKYSRPLLPVVARITRRLAGQDNSAACQIHYDVLSCGHEIVDDSAMLGHEPARHRRCKECRDVAHHVSAEVIHDRAARVS